MIAKVISGGQTGVDSAVRPIPFAPGYFVSAGGHVFSDRSGSWLMLKPDPDRRTGHLRVTLQTDGIVTRQFIHRIMLLVFVGSPPTNDHETRHLDGDPANNAITNLAWGTRSENMADKKIHGTEQIGARNPNAVLTEDDVLRIKGMIANGTSQYDIAAEYNVSQGCIACIANGLTWSHVVCKEMTNRRRGRGANHMRAKLTDDCIRDIRRRSASGENGPDIAARYGVTRANVNKILRGEAWKHVTD